jgi:hypothetical protein
MSLPVAIISKNFDDFYKTKTKIEKLMIQKERQSKQKSLKTISWLNKKRISFSEKNVSEDIEKFRSRKNLCSKLFKKLSDLNKGKNKSDFDMDYL